MKLAARLALMAVPAMVAMPSVPVAAADDAPQLDRTYLRYSGATRAMRKWMVCEVSKNQAGARQIFEAPFGSLEQNNAAQTFFGNNRETDCLTLVARRMSVNGLASLGAVAEILIKRDTPTGTARKLLPNPVSGGGSFVWTSGRVTREQEYQHVPLAFCLVDTQPAKVAAVLAADETGNTERQLFNAMTAEIRNCTPAGTQQTYQPMFLRGALAIAYLYASRPADASSSAGAANDQNAQAGER